MNEHDVRLALVGRMGSGKSTGAEILANQGFTRLSFADPIRATNRLIWGDPDPKYREHMQGLGAKVREIDPDAWLNALRIPNEGDLVVDDCRFHNEYERLAEAGFVFVRMVADRNTRVSRLRANGKLEDEGQLEDITEQFVDDFEVQYAVENAEWTTPLELTAEILQIAQNEREATYV